MKPHIQSKKASRTDWHAADIKAELEKAGWSLRRLAAHHGYSPTTIIAALRRPYPNSERLIAEAIGIEPWKIWPSRYEADHRPIRKRRYPLTLPKNMAKSGRVPKKKDNRPEKSGNVNIPVGD